MSELLNLLRRVNRAIALLAGIALLACAAFIIVDVALRQANASFGGTEEIAGYVMAGVTTWGFAYALLERAHVRIDLIRGRLPGLGRGLLDLFAIASLAVVAVIVAQRGWPVLEKSIANQSRANTVLETPLWIPQLVWLSGLVWFAAMACVLTFAAAFLLMAGQRDTLREMVGPPGTLE